MTPVQLDYYPVLKATEVGDIWADWVLAPELGAVQLPGAKDPPEPLLDFSLVVTQETGIHSKF